MTTTIVMIATGRATCKICNHKIAKGLESVEFSTYAGGRASGQIHRDNKICDNLRIINNI